MKTITIPAVINKALDMGASLAISISGGKDGQAMARALVDHWNANDFTGDIFAVHADLGRIEWKESLPACKKLCSELGIELKVVKRTKGDMVDRWKERMEQLAGTATNFWSGFHSRYCTSDLKRDPINKELRKHRFVISAEGIRAQESDARSKKPKYELRKRITFKRLRSLPLMQAINKREKGEGLAITWNPILNFKAEDVWQSYGHDSKDLARRQKLYAEGNEAEALDGWDFHPAYVYGNERVSCSMCVLACNSDIKNGIEHNPEVYEELRQMEIDSGHTFKSGTSLEDIKNS